MTHDTEFYNSSRCLENAKKMLINAASFVHNVNSNLNVKEEFVWILWNSEISDPES